MAAASGECAYARSTPCYELSITLPKDSEVDRAAEEPEPVFIPISGHAADASRAIRVYAAESTDPRYTADGFKRTFLESWFAKPEYFGQSAVLTRDEHVPIDWSTGTITHFTITTDAAQVSRFERDRGFSPTAFMDLPACFAKKIPRLAPASATRL